MTTNEIIRCFDIVAHFFIFLVLVHVVLNTPREMLWARLFKVVSAFLSLFLAVTCWRYGRTPTFLMAHTLWEYTLALNLIVISKFWSNLYNEYLKK